MIRHYVESLFFVVQVSNIFLSFSLFSSSQKWKVRGNVNFGARRNREREKEKDGRVQNARSFLLLLPLCLFFFFSFFLFLPFPFPLSFLFSFFGPKDYFLTKCQSFSCVYKIKRKTKVKIGEREKKFFDRKLNFFLFFFNESSKGEERKKEERKTLGLEQVKEKKKEIEGEKGKKEKIWKKELKLLC